MKKLAIGKVEVFQADIALREVFRISIMEFTCVQSVFVRISASDGTYGVGEANPTWRISGETQATALAAAPDLGRLLLGRDPRDLEGCTGALDAYLTGNSSVRGAFDVALYDLAAKTAGLPLYAFLGGGARRFWTDHTIGIAEPDVMAEKAAKHLEAGFTAIKVKLGTTVDEDVERIRRIRDAVGPSIPVRIDANQAWDFATAAAALRALEGYGIEYCEQPVAYWDVEAMRRLRGRTSIAIMADESLFDHHDAVRLASLGACDYFNIKLAKAGGIHTALKITAIAEGAGIPCMVGCMNETRLGLSAAAHLVSARPHIRYADLDGLFFLAEDPIIGGARWNGGQVTVTDAPGHGADVDPAFLARWPHRVID